MKLEDIANTTWYTKMGAKPIRDISDEHLTNIERTIKRESKRKYFCNLTRTTWLNIIQLEKKSRNNTQRVKKVAHNLLTKTFKGTFADELSEALNQADTKQVITSKPITYEKVTKYNNIILNRAK